MNNNAHEDEFYGDLLKLSGFGGSEDDDATVTVGNDDDAVTNVNVDAGASASTTKTASDAAAGAADSGEGEALTKFASMNGMTVSDIMAHPKFDEGFAYEMQRDPLFQLRMVQLGLVSAEN